MYLSKLIIENFRCFGERDERFELALKPGLTALVGKNESGKTAVIDALRFALGTTDQEWYRPEDSDFYGEETKREIRIVCTFEGLNAADKRAFVEFLTYGEKAGDEPVLHLNWTAKDTGENRKGRPYRRVEVHSGKDGNGPSIPLEARDSLQATYLRPLRDADESLSAGRGSRLAQVLRHFHPTKTGSNEYDPDRLLKEQKLSVLGIGNLTNSLLVNQEGVSETRGAIDKNLKELSLRRDLLKSDIKVGGAAPGSPALLRELLEKLDLRLGGDGKLGLGSDNLLFIACELLLLGQEDEGSKLLLIEEPEAHLDAQRQLRVMTFLQTQAVEKRIQVIVTTHSPNLASAIELDNMVMIHNRRAFSLAKGQTELEPTDYRFLKRFLDVTKANLFFARGVVIVEGDAENILLPTLAKLLDRGFTENGVSIVNVGSVGLRRYARIFQRKGVKSDDEHLQLAVPVACITDMDVMPDCAPVILGKWKEGEPWPETSPRRWKAKRDFSEVNALALHQTEKKAKASGQYVETFVSDEWTLEYDLAYSGLAEDVYVAVHLAGNDESLNNASLKTVAKAARDAQRQFKTLEQEANKTVADGKASGCSCEEFLATKVYAQFTKGTKAIAAQYLAGRLERKNRKRKLTPEYWRKQLPTYLIDAIDYVTGGTDAGEAVPNEEPQVDE